jgi:hypothetical protein
MKLENFFFAFNVLKHIQKNPNCTIPQLRDIYGLDKEKSLYKVTSYLNNHGFIDKIDNKSLTPGGPHFFLRVSQRGLQTISTFKELFTDVSSDSIAQKYNLSESDSIRYDDLSTDFSKFSYGIINSLLQGLLDQLPLDARRFLLSKRSRINILIEKSHAQLQEKVSEIIGSLI